MRRYPPAVFRLPSVDGVELAVHDLGGDGPPLLMAHATGFCGPVLAPLGARLTDRFHCWAFDARGHGDTLTPPDLDWSWAHFGDDVLAVVDGLRLHAPFGFGHSSGGAAVLDAEARRPGMFAALWCFEPIVWPALTEELARSREPLIAGALRRREGFGSRQEAYDNFSSKPPLDSLDPEALRAYVDCGFRADGDGDTSGGVRLRCPPDVEAAIYRHGLVHDGFSRLPEVRCPVTLAHGGRSLAMGREVVEAQVAALPRARLVTFPDLGHFGPLGDLDAVAASIRDSVAPPR